MACSAPRHPGSHTHAMATEEHSPRPLHAFGQLKVAHAVPPHSGAHRHVPSIHSPWPKHGPEGDAEPGHDRSEQSAPVHESWHAQLKLTHRP